MVRRLVSLVAVSVVLAAAGAMPARADVSPSMQVPARPGIAADGESVVVSWAPVAGADGYRVQVSFNGGPYVDAGSADGATSSLVVDELRSRTMPCGQGPCSVTAEVAETSGPFQSAYSAPSVAVALPMPYAISMSVARRTSPRQVTLILFGTSLPAGQVVHLLKMSSERIWQDTGVTTTVHRQRVPGHRRTVRAWLFTIVVRSRGLSNYRVEVPTAGARGRGTSRPYGVRR